MKKFVLLFFICLGFGIISCGNSVKKGVDTSDSIVSEDTTIYRVSKFVIPNSSDKVYIYKSPSKSSLKLIFKECMEEGEEDCGYYKWSNEGANVISVSKEYNWWWQINTLPVIGEENGWYKVFIRLNPKSQDNRFIGYISREDCYDTQVLDVSLEDVKKVLYDREFDTPVYNHNGFYIKWGFYEPDGNVLFVGKILDGKAYESEWINYSVNYPSYEGDTWATNKISVSNEKKEFEFSNKSYAKKGEYGGYEADFSKLSDEDFNKVISLPENNYPNMYIKIKGVSKLFLIREGETVNGRKIVWDY